MHKFKTAKCIISKSISTEEKLYHKHEKKNWMREWTKKPKSDFMKRPFYFLNCSNLISLSFIIKVYLIFKASSDGLFHELSSYFMIFRDSFKCTQNINRKNLIPD